MSALTREALFDSSLRLAQGGLVVDAALQGAFRGLRQHQDTNRAGVYRLADRLRSARAGEARALGQAEDLQAGYAAMEAALRAEQLRSATLQAEIRAEREAHLALQAEHAYIVEAYVR